MTRRSVVAIALAIAAGAFAATARPAAAQIESALLSKVSFNLTSPGGKSLAMGGAFTAIADDATTAFANPAGLGLLSAVEAGLSFKRLDDVVGLETARSTATGGLLAPYPDVRSVSSSLGRTVTGVEYAGAVVPVSRRLVLAVTYAQNLAFEADPGADGYSYVELRDNRSGGASRRDFLYEYREFGSVKLTNRLVGLTAGYRVSERLRVGAGVTLNRVSFALDGDAAGPHRIVNRTFLSPTEIETRAVSLSVEDLSGTAAGLVLGVHGDLLRDGLLTAGASYRWTSRTNGTFVIGGDVPQALAGRERRPFSFTVPADATIGVASRPLPGLTISAEGQWIDYGSMIDVPLPVVSYRGLVGPSPGFPVEGLLANVEAPSSVIVPRFGVEYVARGGEGLTLAFRLGYHRDPARGVRSDVKATDGSGTAFDVNDPPLSQAVRTVFDGGRPDDRFSGGLGVTLPFRLSLDVAFDLGRSSRVLSASMFYRF